MLSEPVAGLKAVGLRGGGVARAFWWGWCYHLRVGRAPPLYPSMASWAPLPLPAPKRKRGRRGEGACPSWGGGRIGGPQGQEGLGHAQVLLQEDPQWAGHGLASTLPFPSPLVQVCCFPSLELK